MGLLPLRDYPFEEFLMHFQAMETVRDYTEVRFSYSKDRPAWHVGTDRDEESTRWRVMDYFAQLSDPPDHMKGAAFMGAMYWLARHTAELVKADCVKDRGGGLVDFPRSTLQAFHEELKKKRWESLKVKVGPVVKRARVLFKEAEAEEAEG